MRLKPFALLLPITLNSYTLLGEENNEPKNFDYKNNIQSTLNNQNLGKIIIHIVQKGDTISSISKKYSIKKESIIKVNKLLDENYIFIGQNLKIVENIIPENNNKDYYHEIKKGENLTEIANKYNLSLSKLVEINGIENPNALEIGTKIKLKEVLSTNNDSPINELQDPIVIDKPIKNKYGPLVIEYDKTNIVKRSKLINATHTNGKKFILNINCENKKINVRGIGRKWKGWKPAREEFEDELLNDFCRKFN